MSDVDHNVQNIGKLDLITELLPFSVFLFLLIDAICKLITDKYSAIQLFSDVTISMVIIAADSQN